MHMLAVALVAILVLTFSSLRAHILAADPNSTQITLADRAFDGPVSTLDLLQMRTDAMVAATIHKSCIWPAVRCIFSLTRTATTHWYCETQLNIDLHKEMCRRDYGTVA
jgi:hypothetical protein